jgi:hypothetical protein
VTIEALGARFAYGFGSISEGVNNAAFSALMPLLIGYSVVLETAVITLGILLSSVIAFPARAAPGTVGDDKLFLLGLAVSELAGPLEAEPLPGGAAEDLAARRDHSC